MTAPFTAKDSPTIVQKVYAQKLISLQWVTVWEIGIHTKELAIEDIPRIWLLVWHNSTQLCIARIRKWALSNFMLNAKVNEEVL